ncbi:store-operated calcium entry regulator STIMATE-like [Branchiostoma floridae x Branchiostoma japonicum]
MLLGSVSPSEAATAPEEPPSWRANLTTGDGATLDLFPSDDGGLHHCSHGALMGRFGVLIQGILGIVAFSTLMLKRYREPKGERRPWRIWFYDTSKQAIGAAFIHFANVFLADMFQGDPCTWYIINFLLDSTVGLLLIYLGLKFTQCVVRWRRWDTLTFGEYGEPPQCNAWFGQCALYLLVMVFEKCAVALFVQLPFWDDVRKFILSPIHDPKVELAIVMLIIPFIINALMFWVVDNFLMRKHRKLNGSVHVKQGRSKVKYYRKKNSGEKKEDSESEVLLSPSDESDRFEEETRTIPGDITQRQLLVPTRESAIL